jgi:hypothetical protein
VQYVTHLGHPVVVCSLVGGELSIDRLFERRNAPHLGWIRGVCPHPFARPEYPVVVLERSGASKRPRVVHAAGVAQ